MDEAFFEEHKNSITIKNYFFLCDFFSIIDYLFNLSIFILYLKFLLNDIFLN